MESHGQHAFYEFYMTPEMAIDLGRQGIFVAMVVCAPVLLLGLLTGLLVSFLQAITQIQEPTLAFIPKMAVIAVTLLICSPYMITMLVDFLRHIFLFAQHLNK